MATNSSATLVEPTEKAPRPRGLIPLSVVIFGAILVSLGLPKLLAASDKPRGDVIRELRRVQAMVLIHKAGTPLPKNPTYTSGDWDARPEELVEVHYRRRPEYVLDFRHLEQLPRLRKLALTVELPIMADADWEAVGRLGAAACRASLYRTGAAKMVD